MITAFLLTIQIISNYGFKMVDPNLDSISANQH